MRSLRRLAVFAVFAVPALLATLWAAPAPPPHVVAPADNLVVEGVPAIPASLADELAPYTEIRRALFAGWHPTKREMLVVTRFGDTFQVHHVAAPGAARRQLTFFKDHVRAGVRYRPKTGDAFSYLRDEGGNENFQLYRYDLATGASTLLSDGASRNTGNRFSHAGDRVVYGSTRRNGNDVDVWVEDVGDPKSARMLCELSGGGWSVDDWSPDDARIVVTEGISANESYLWVVDAKTGEKTLATPKGGKEKVAYGGCLFSTDGKGLYVTTDRDSEFQRLAHVDLATKKHTYLTSHISWDVDSFDLSSDGKSIAFVTNEEGLGVLHLLDTATGKERPAPKLPAGTVTNVEFHENGHDLAFGLDSSRAANDVFSVDLTTGKVDRWTYSEPGGLNTDSFSEPELVRWKSFDGRMISGFLYKPPASFTGKRPVVISIHGGPEGQFRPGFLGATNYHIRTLGAAVLYPNVRGSTGYGKTFLTLDNGFSREDSYKDIDTLLDWLKTRPDLDASRVMVTGGSYGGHMTLAVATHYDAKIRCALDVVGMSNLVSFLENTSGYRRDLRRVEYGDERDPKMREFLLKIAPITNASKVTKPLFVVQGQNDPRVPKSEAEQMVATIRKNGTPVWYLMAKDEGHGFAKKPNAAFQLYATVLFMKQYLLN